MTPQPAKLTLYKRWRLRQGVDRSTVVAFVRGRVIPHYARLDPQVQLELEQLDESTLLAIQRWPSRGRRNEAMSGDRFERWWQQYLPIVEEWDAMLEFDAEWEGTVLID
ncbi:hypothetical protein [Ornithinicoccus halotolerans]|uniref:hypothetical protein n=1 Tax=Ornithinicoccus halotolerans TaxID=1748220 RepID=UPI001297037B|nr:hypothetical protein [Ornithinicoccus halotolerans]